MHGGVGDVLGYGMRRGRVFVKGDAGYRAGIHMKAHEGSGPAVVCGGKARDFFGEYMAGGLLVLLGIESGAEGPIVGAHLGAGMHGGEIYVRGEVESWQCGGEVRIDAGHGRRARGARAAARRLLPLTSRWTPPRCWRRRSRASLRPARGPTRGCTRTSEPGGPLGVARGPPGPRARRPAPRWARARAALPPASGAPAGRRQ